MTTTTTTKKQDWNNQHFFAWDGVKAKYPIDDLCLCGKRRDARKNKNYPLHFPETTPYTHRVTLPTDTTTSKYKRWLEQERPGLPPLPQDYIDSQIEAVELYLQWLHGEGLK